MEENTQNSGFTEGAVQNTETPVSTQTNLEDNKKVKMKKTLLISAIVVVLAVTAVSFAVFSPGQIDPKYQKKIDKWETKQEQKSSYTTTSGDTVSSQEESSSSGASSDSSSSDENVTGSVSYKEEYTVTTKKGVVYGSASGMSLTVDIYTPNGVSGPTPAIMYIHGGGFHGGSANGVADDSLMLAKHGVAVVAVNYRLSGTAIFPAPLYDVKGATRFIRANASTYNIDPNAIFSLGESAGGVLASLLGVTGNYPSLEGTIGGYTSYSSKVSGVINISGSYMVSIVDTMSGGIKNSIGNEVGCSPVPSTECSSAYSALSPETYIDSTDAPFIILHGDKDQSVPTVQAETLNSELKSIGVESSLYVASDLAHVGGLLSRYLDEVISFINANS